MNLFFRIVIVWLKSLMSKPIGILDECRTRFQVWFTDQDAFRHMTNSRYFSLTDVSVVDYMFQTRAWPKLRAKGWMPHIVYEDMVFLKALRWGNRFTVKTRFLGWDENYVVAQHIFERDDGRVAAEGYTVARFVSMRGERIPTGRVLGLLGHDASSPPLSSQAQDILSRAIRGHGLTAPRLVEALPEAA